MNDMDHLEIMDLDSEEEICIPTEEELEEDMNPCGCCTDCY
jgi:hypothetical protein